MRAVAVSVWIFMNLVFLGMCGYIYLLWSQYWNYVERQQLQMANIVNINSYNSNNQIFYYPRRLESPTVDTVGVTSRRLSNRWNRTFTVVRRRSRPRFPKLRSMEIEPRSGTPKCVVDCATPSLEDIGKDRLLSRVSAHKSQLVVQLRRVLLEESSVFKAKGDSNNPYNVQYAGPRGTYTEKSVQQLVCELKQRVDMRTLSKEDEPFRSLGLAESFPDAPLFDERRCYNTCAIVSNAGSLYKSGLGAFIDSHELVVRFNHAPTEGYTSDVGSKTSLRILNSQVVSKPVFGFLDSPLYRGMMLLAWDPSNYSATLDEWYKNPDFDLFSPYFEHRVRHPSGVFHLLDPRALWTLWEYIQSHIPIRIRKNPPSSGFLGLALTLPHCRLVDLVEYVPSLRLTKRCHYWDVTEDSSCTFGVWHPLAAEKLLTLALNIADDAAVFSQGYVRVPGYDALSC
uniref:Beta-galactoside alpha-2,6-sialyltransferase 1 n=1 Tax=Timema tahoe TaxID=61484 RepID=A0A7R9IHJ4_9NEOP|nr:unnamed protein product [Timema tahoe]